MCPKKSRNVVHKCVAILSCLSVFPAFLNDIEKAAVVTPPLPPSLRLFGRILAFNQVLTNADTPEQAETARKLGAQGIGLCRTEHMFFDPTRISAMRAMIVAEDKAERIQHLDTLSEFQRADITDMLKCVLLYSG